MSSTGILLILVALFLAGNADKLAWVFQNKLTLNIDKPWGDGSLTSSGSW